MSFQMVHMEIAYRVAEMTGIKERAAFILGSVLPDSVHMRDDYSIEQKIMSHLFEGFVFSWRAYDCSGNSSSLPD